MNTIWKLSSTALEQGESRGDQEMIERALMGREVIWNGVFGGRMKDKNHVIKCFEQHNQEVIDSVPQEQLWFIALVTDGSPYANFCKSLCLTQNIRESTRRKSF